MLLTMRALNEAMRAFAYTEAVTMDQAHHGRDPERQARLDLMIPVVKGWLTEIGMELASLGVQVHGGMGFVEETGAAQYMRDARIAPIYEGTNGIQAQDLVARKLGRDGGAAMEALLAEADETVVALGQELPALQKRLHSALSELRESSGTLLSLLGDDRPAALSRAFDYMMQTGYVMGGWHLARSALVARRRLDQGSDNPFYQRKLATASFYMESILPRARGHAGAIAGSDSLQDYAENWL
jgi:hypothetical protein